MKEYLEQRIAHLKKVEMEYFDKSVDKQFGYHARQSYRRFSNEFNAARRECELMLKELNAGKIINVVENATPQAASELIESCAELIRSLSRLNNNNKDLLLKLDIERLERAKSILPKYADETPRIVQSEKAVQATEKTGVLKSITTIEDILNPQYINDTYTWGQVKKAMINAGLK